VDNFIQQAYDVINFQMYLKHNTKYKDSNIKQNSQSNDYIDIDLAYKEDPLCIKNSITMKTENIFIFVIWTITTLKIAIIIF